MNSYALYSYHLLLVLLLLLTRRNFIATISGIRNYVGLAIFAAATYYDFNTKLDDVTCDNIKVGHLIDKEAIKPVFLRMDSELADKGKK